MSRCFGQEVSHRGTFVDKETDEAARLCQRQRVTEQLHRLVLFAMCLESDRLEHHHLEPFILPTPWPPPAVAMTPAPPVLRRGLPGPGVPGPG